MFSTNHLFVQSLIDEKLAAAAAERLVAKPSTWQLKARLDGVLKGTWSLLSGPAERPATPTLVNYPFRG